MNNYYDNLRVGFYVGNQKKVDEYVELFVKENKENIIDTTDNIIFSDGTRVIILKNETDDVSVDQILLADVYFNSVKPDILTLFNLYTPHMTVKNNAKKFSDMIKNTRVPLEYAIIGLTLDFDEAFDLLFKK